MHIEPERRSAGYGGAIFAVVMVALLSYLTYAALQGEHGLFRLFQIEAQQQRLEVELAQLRAERDLLENKVRRLSNDYLDLDLLDEQARRTLGYARPDEIILPPLHDE